MRTRKRILSMLMAVCLIVGMLPTTAFAADTCTVTFYLEYPDGGYGSYEKTALAFEEVTLESPESYGFTVRDGYEFDGWRRAEDGTTYGEGESYTVTGDVEFYTNWKENNNDDSEENNDDSEENLHEVNVTVSGEGCEASGGGYYSAGDLVILNATPADGYYFVKWDVQAGDVELTNLTSMVITFVMPEEYVWVRAVFDYVPADEYSVTVGYVGDGQGTVTANKNVAAEGDRIVLTAEAAEGSEFQGWLHDEYDNTTTSEFTLEFTMPADNVVVEAMFDYERFCLDIVDGVTGESIESNWFANGYEISISAGTKSGYHFAGWISDGGWKF